MRWVNKVAENNGLLLEIFAYITAWSVRILSFSGPYSVGMRQNTDQNNSEYRKFSRSDFLSKFLHYFRFSVAIGQPFLSIHVESYFY